jgi:hypothetical protein
MARLLVALLLLGLAGASTAAEVSKEDAAAIRKVISDQIDAFARDDGPGAFALATAGIQATFGTAEAFIEMVKSQYQVVYRPKSVQFQPPEIVQGEVVQAVRMTDAAGGVWLAIYPMQREAGHGWRTNGCLLHRLPGLQT